MASLLISARNSSRLTWGISVLIGLVLLYYVTYLHGVGKLTGADGLAGFFAQALGVGVWAVVLSGIAEVFGPFMMLYWRTAFYGAVLVVVNFLTASWVVWQGGKFPTEELTYVVLGLIVAWMLRPDFLRPTPVITTVQV